MRNGLEIMTDTEAALDAVCGCDRERCPVCRLRAEVTAYLDAAIPSRKLPAKSWSEAVGE